MSVEEFHRMTIPWKGTDGVITETEILLKKTLKFGEFGAIFKKGGFDLATQSITDIQAFMVTLIQFSVHSAPFDPKLVDFVYYLRY